MTPSRDGTDGVRSASWYNSEWRGSSSLDDLGGDDESEGDDDGGLLARLRAWL